MSGDDVHLRIQESLQYINTTFFNNVDCANLFSAKAYPNTLTVFSGDGIDWLFKEFTPPEKPFVAGAAASNTVKFKVAGSNYSTTVSATLVDVRDIYTGPYLAATSAFVRVKTPASAGVAAVTAPSLMKCDNIPITNTVLTIDFLSVLYIMYGLLNPRTPFPASVQKNPTDSEAVTWTEKIPTLATASLNTILASCFPVQEIFGSFNDDSKFVLRRVIYLYIILMNYKIAMNYSFPTAATAATAANLVVPNAIYGWIQQMNYVIKNKGGAATVLNDRINRRVKTYATQVDGINTLDDTVTDNKDVTALTQTENDKQVELVRKSKMFSYVAISVLVCVGVGSCAIVMLTNSTRSTRMITGGVLIATSVVAAIVVNYLFGYEISSKEGFTTYSRYDTLPSTTTIANIDLQFKRQVLAYLENTMYVVNTLRTYKAYGNMNKSLDREIANYTVVNERLQSATSKLKQSIALVTFHKKMYEYQIAFFILLSILLSVSVTLYVVFEESPTMQGRIMQIAIAITVIMFITIIIAQNSLVHTDPRKKYWMTASIGSINAMG